MPATFDIPIQQVIPGQIIASALWNNEFKNIFDNFTPGGVDDYSSTTPQMQTQTDPYPGSVLSLPTSLAGEMERMRFVQARNAGVDYWYEPPVKTNEELDEFVKDHTHTGADDGTQIPAGGLADNAVTTPKIADSAVTYAKLAPGVIIPSGAVTVFYQAAAPVGFTLVTTHNDKAMRVVSGAGGGSGGSSAFSSGFAHSHTVNSHTHDLGNHTHSTPNHSHDLDRALKAYGGTGTTHGSTQKIGAEDDGSGFMTTYVVSGVATSQNNMTLRTSTENSGAGTTGAPSSNNSGAAAPGTDTATYTPAYIDMILCSKD